jgi:trk system potassium uptake protein TrkA
MNVLIVGCGREGSELARSIARQGHAVTVLDVDAVHFDRLGVDFPGRTVQGFSIDRGALERAGIATADAFVATTQSDNENIVAAKVARDVYGVKRVAARVYNPGRREVYERLGLATVTSTSWGARRLEQLILHPNVIDMEQIGHGEVKLLRIQAPAAWCDRSVTAVLDGNGVVCAIARDGKAFVPPPTETLKTGDHVYLSIPSSRLDEILALIQNQ